MVVSMINAGYFIFFVETGNGRGFCVSCFALECLRTLNEMFIYFFVRIKAFIGDKLL